MAKRTAARPTPKPSAASTHQHGKGRCVAILKKLSAYLDDELPGDICSDLRRHLGACPNCEEFLTALRQTVTLCRHQPAPALSAAERARMRATILKAARPR